MLTYIMHRETKTKGTAWTRTGSQKYKLIRIDEKGRLTGFVNPAPINSTVQYTLPHKAMLHCLRLVEQFKRSYPHDTFNNEVLQQIRTQLASRGKF